MRFFARAALCFLATGCQGQLFTDDEWSRLMTLVNVDEDPLPDPVNKYVGNPDAIALGQMFFFDTRLSGVATGIDTLRRPTSALRTAVGQPVQIACATCHDPSRGGVDHSSVPGNVSIGAGIYDVNAESVINAAYYALKYWNGRYDSLVWQAMSVTESPVSMNSDRMRVVWLINDLYRDRFEAVFGEYAFPELGRSFEEQAARVAADGQCLLEAGACPSECTTDNTGCWPRFPIHARPGDGNCVRGEAPLGDAFDCMAAADRDTVTRAYVNYAKALAAYEYELVSRNSAFDRFIIEDDEDSEIIPAAARRGAKLFVGKASCIDCHHGSLFSDGEFHNVGVPQAGAGVPTEADCPSGAACDCIEGKACTPWGAWFGLNALKTTKLRADHPSLSDEPVITDRLKVWYDFEITDWLKGAWRTPSLRDVAITAPYMHDGYYRSLDEVLDHYAQGGTRLGSASDQVDPRIRPLDLTESEMQDLLEFLKTLTGEPLPAEPSLSPRFREEKTMKLVITWLLLPLTASAGEADCKDAFEKGYAAGREIQSLRAEVQELRAIVAKLVDAIGKGNVAEIPMPKMEQEQKETPRAVPPKDSGGEAGTITGKITFLDGSNNAFVYVENVPGRLARGRRLNMSQRNKQFAPRFMVVQKGTEVSFPNEDPIYHNVFSQNALANFDLGIYRKGDETKSYVFTKPGLVDIYCNMHSKMSAEILVVPNHLYTQVQPNGTFRLVRVPEGRRKVVAWSPGSDLVSAWVEVSGSAPSEVKLTLLPRNKGSHTTKNGQPYGSYQ